MTATDRRGPFAVLLRQYRETAGLSQEELAERAALSQRGISDLERGARRSPHPATVRRLMKALHLSLSERAALQASARPPSMLPADVPASPPLPVPLTSFIGRERELAEVRRLMAVSRLLTLTGAGGVGKTRLALESARSSADVAFVDLAPLSDSRLVGAAIASALDIHEQPNVSLLDLLTETLASRRALLILDNCEHLVAACAELAAALLQRCPNLRILATSREPLGMSGEMVWRVPSLALPDPATQSGLEQLACTDGVRLFVERVQAADSSFALTATNAQAITDICRRLDGLPLALELAAPRVPVLGVEMLCARLGDALFVLTSGRRTGPARQQTLRATITWSYELLSPAQRLLFARLAVFAGGWTVESVVPVCSGEGIAAAEVVGRLVELVDQSLVVAEPGGLGSMRYRLLEPLRQYARERLRELGEERELSNRHRDWCIELAEAAWPALIGPDQRTWLIRLEREHDNLRAALELSLQDPSDATPALRLAGALHWFWWRHGHVAEGRAWLARTLAFDARVGTSAEPRARCARVRALRGAGVLARAEGAFPAAETSFAASVALARELGDTAAVAEGLYWLGYSALYRGQREPGAALIAESLALWRQVGDPWGMTWPLGSIALRAAQLGDYEQATRLQQERLRLARAAGDPRVIANVYTHLGNIAYQQGQHDVATELLEAGRQAFAEAGDSGEGLAWVLHGCGLVARARGEPAQSLEYFRQSLVWFQKLGELWGVGDCLEGIAGVLCDLGQFEAATRIMGTTAALRNKLGISPAGLSAPRQGPDPDAAHAALGTARFDALFHAGQAVPIDKAITEALAVGRLVQQSC